MGIRPLYIENAVMAGGNIMKLEDICKMNNELIVKESETFVFLKKLYDHAVESLDKVPESFVKEVIEKARHTGATLEEIFISEGWMHEKGTTRVNLGGFNEETRAEFGDTYLIKEEAFDSDDFAVLFYFDDASIVGFLDMEYSRFNNSELKKIFGESLIECSPSEIKIAVKAFK